MSAHPSDEQMAAHLDGTASSDERAATAAHLGACARCREELSLAGRARDILRELPEELEPPADVAAGVARAAAGGSVGPADAGASGPPRWYRAAGIAAVAAAIGLAAVIVPNLGERPAQERATGRAQTDAAAPGAASGPAESAAPSPVEAAPSGSPVAGSQDAPAVERLEGDLDAAGLHALLRDTRLESLDLRDSTGLLTEPKAGIVACSRRAGGTAIIPPEARPVRLFAGTFQGIPARIAIFAVGRGEDAQLRAVAAATEDCRLLAADATSRAAE